MTRIAATIFVLILIATVCGLVWLTALDGGRVQAWAGIVGLLCLATAIALFAGAFIGAGSGGP